MVKTGDLFCMVLSFASVVSTSGSYSQWVTIDRDSMYDDSYGDYDSESESHVYIYDDSSIEILPMGSDRSLQMSEDADKWAVANVSNDIEEDIREIPVNLKLKAIEYNPIIPDKNPVDDMADENPVDDMANENPVDDMADENLVDDMADEIDTFQEDVPTSSAEEPLSSEQDDNSAAQDNATDTELSYSYKKDGDIIFNQNQKGTLFESLTLESSNFSLEDFYNVIVRPARSTRYAGSLEIVLTRKKPVTANNIIRIKMQILKDAASAIIGVFVQPAAKVEIDTVPSVANLLITDDGSLPFISVYISKIGDVTEVQADDKENSVALATDISSEHIRLNNKGIGFQPGIRFELQSPSNVIFEMYNRIRHALDVRAIPSQMITKMIVAAATLQFSSMIDKQKTIPLSLFGYNNSPFWQFLCDVKTDNRSDTEMLEAELMRIIFEFN